jgi:hypothetical protein
MISGIFLIIRLVFLPLSVDTRSDIPDKKPSSAYEVLYEHLGCHDLDSLAFRLAYEGYLNLNGQGVLEKDSILTLIDFSKPSTEERLFIIDLKHEKVLEKTLVAHGKNTGTLYAEHFSNTPHSNQSSLGFYVTDHTYLGKHGYSLRIRGVEPGINHKAWDRAIVIHGANYVSTSFIKKYGRLGRSFGCPALPPEQNSRIIDLIKDKSCLFIFSPNEDYFNTTSLISSSDYLQTKSE